MGKRSERGPTSCHDRLFRFAFGQPRHARPLLRHLLPAPIARRIDWATLAPAPATKAGPGLRLHHGDL